MKKQKALLRAIQAFVVLEIAVLAGCMLDNPVQQNTTDIENQARQADSSQVGSNKRSGAEVSSSSRFPTDQCTWYAASEFDKVAPSPGCNWGGNAGTWIGNASAAGWRTYGYPTAAGNLSLSPGTVVVWTGGGYGHVAVLRYVVQNGIYIQEKNWPYGSGVSSWRFFYWSQVLNRGSYTFSGYIAPWRK